MKVARLISWLRTPIINGSYVSYMYTYTNIGIALRCNGAAGENFCNEIKRRKVVEFMKIQLINVLIIGRAFARGSSSRFIRFIYLYVTKVFEGKGHFTSRKRTRR